MLPDRMSNGIGRVDLRRSRADGDVRHGPAAMVLVAYLLLSSAAAAWLSPPEVAKAALALPALALIPLLVGAALLRLLPILGDTSGLDGFGRSLIEWLVGSLALVTLAVVLQLSGQAFLLRRFGLVALALAAGGALASRTLTDPPARLRMEGSTALALSAAVLLSMTPKIIAALSTPFPLVAGSFLDPLYFAQPALRVLEHGYLELDNPSHAPGLITLTAILSQLYGADPLSILWMGPFLLLAVFGAGLFLWARAVSGRPTTALLVTAVGLFILTGNSALSGMPLALRSNRLLFALFPLALYVTHRLLTEGDASRRAKVEALVALQASIGVLFVAMNAYRLGLFSQEVRIPLMLAVAAALGLLVTVANQRRWRWAGLLALFSVIVAFQVFHVFEGPVYLTGLIIYGLALTLRGSRVEGTVAAGLCLAVLGFFFLQFSGVLSFPRDFSLSSAVFGSTYDNIPVDFTTRVELLEDVLSPVVIALMLLGAAGCLAKRVDFYGRAVVMAAAVMFVVYLLPDAFAFRTSKGMAPFLAFLVVVGADGVAALARQAVRWAGRDRPLIQEALQLGMVAAVLPALFLPFLEHTASLRPGERYHSSVADVEYALADWFREHTEENVRIISDYQTMLLLSSLSNKVSLTERNLYPVEMSAAGREQMAYIKDAVLRAPDGCAAHAAIRSLAGSEPARERRYLGAIGAGTEEPRYFVVWTAKTFLWSEQERGIEPIGHPTRGDVFPTMVTPFSDPRFFRLAALIGHQAYVFEVLPTTAQEAPASAAVQPARPPGSAVLGKTAAPAGDCAPGAGRQDQAQAPSLRREVLASSEAGSSTGSSR